MTSEGVSSFHFSFSIQLSTLFKHLVRLPLKRFQIVVKIEGNLLLVLLRYENDLKMSCRTLWCCCESVASILCSPYAPIDKEGRHGSVRITKKKVFCFPVCMHFQRYHVTETRVTPDYRDLCYC